MSEFRLHRSWWILVTVAGLIWSLTILTHPVYGFNYHLYRYFAELSNSGIDVFHLDDASSAVSPQYLDFTPADLMLYKFIFYTQHGVPRAWFVYQLSWAWCAIGFAGVLAIRQQFDPARLWALAVVMVISPAWMILAAISGEDKLINAAFPLLLCLLAPSNAAAALLAGALYAGISGFGLLYMPLLAVTCWQRWPGQWGRLVLLGALAVGVIALTWLPFWPGAKVMLANRAHRESLPPFWYSIWMLAPGLFSPLLSKALTLVVVAFATLAYWRGRTSLLAAMIAIAFAYFVTTNFLNHNRIAPMLILPLLALRKGPGWWIYAGLAFAQLNIVLGFRLLHIPFPGPDALPWPLELQHVALANMCLLAYLAMFFAGFASRGIDPESPAGVTPTLRAAPRSPIRAAA